MKKMLIILCFSCISVLYGEAVLYDVISDQPNNLRIDIGLGSGMTLVMSEDTDLEMDTISFPLLLSSMAQIKNLLSVGLDGNISFLSMPMMGEDNSFVFNPFELIRLNPRVMYHISDTQKLVETPLELSRSYAGSGYNSTYWNVNYMYVPLLKRQIFGIVLGTNLFIRTDSFNVGLSSPKLSLGLEWLSIQNAKVLVNDSRNYTVKNYTKYGFDIGYNRYENSGYLYHRFGIDGYYSLNIGSLDLTFKAGLDLPTISSDVNTYKRWDGYFLVSFDIPIQSFIQAFE